MQMPLQSLKLTPGTIAVRWNKVMLVLMLSRYPLPVQWGLPQPLYPLILVVFIFWEGGWGRFVACPATPRTPVAMGLHDLRAVHMRAPWVPVHLQE